LDGVKPAVVAEPEQVSLLGADEHAIRGRHHADELELAPSDLDPSSLRIAPRERVLPDHRPDLAVADVHRRDLPVPETRVGPRLAAGEAEQALARADQQLGRSAEIAHRTTIPASPDDGRALLGVAVAVVRLAGDARRGAGELLHDGEADTLGDQLVDLGVLVVGRDREPRRVAADGLVLEP